MYRSPQYPKMLRSKYPEGFAVLDAALKLGDDFMVATQGSPMDTPTRAVVSTLFARLYNLLGASTILLEEGYGIEAGALTRSLIEHFFDVCYLANRGGANPDALAQRFIDYQHVARYLTIKNAKEAGMTLKPKEYEEAERKRQRHWDKSYGWGKGTHPYDWTGLQPRNKARAGGAEDIYLWLNHHFSGMVHSGPDSWRHHVIEEENTTAFLVGPQDTLITLPIPALGPLFAHAVQQMAGLLGLPGLHSKAVETYRYIEEKVKTMNIEI